MVKDSLLRNRLMQPRNGWYGQEIPKPTANDIAWARIIIQDPCAYCGGEAGTIEHVNAAEHGWENLTGACKPCNTGKGQHPLLRYLLAKQLRIQREQITLQIRALGESHGDRMTFTRNRAKWLARQAA